MSLASLKLIARRMGGLMLAAVKAWIRHRVPSKGAALAFYTLFSMAPILVLVMAIAGRILGRQTVHMEIFAQMQGLLGPVGAHAARSLLAGVQAPGAGVRAAWLASIMLVAGATSVFAELKDSLDEIWNIQSPAPVGILAVLRARFLSFGLICVLAFLLMVSLIVDAVLALAARFWGGVWTSALPLISTLSHLFTFLVIASLFAVTYKMLPETKLSWRDVAIGSLSTALLFYLGKHLIGVYLGASALTSSYGAAGALTAMLAWVYYSAQIFFLGAEFTREYALTFGSLRDRVR
jgi:membrane protein